MLESEDAAVPGLDGTWIRRLKKFSGGAGVKTGFATFTGSLLMD